MNKKDREELTNIKEHIEVLVEQLRSKGDAEQNKFDNLSEGLQTTEQGQRYQECADCIESVCSTIEDALDELVECQY